VPASLIHHGINIMHTLSAKLQALPEQVRAGLNLSPAAADWLKVLALLAMLVDHTNTLLLPHLQPELYALGRMAFPLFVLIWARNVLHNPHRLQTRANRMWLWAIVKQPVFSFAFAGHDPWYALNILFVFAGATQLLAWSHRFRMRGLIAGLVLLSLMVWPLSFASYGLSGLVLALSLATFLHSSPGRLSGAVALMAMVALLAINSQHVTQAPAVVMMLSILPTCFLPAAAVGLVRTLTDGHERRFMPAMFFYMAYAGHLFILGLITRLCLM
jgi:type-F conjugative transfer system pilin acetylase TraX